MEKIIQVATCAAENGHSLYVLCEDGKLYERVYSSFKEDEKWLSKQEWKEIKEVEIKD